MNSEMHNSEEEQLDRLADELRGAFPQPELSHAFHDALQARLSQSWSFRAAMQRNGLMRVAAGLLMVSLIAAPVAAIVQMFQAPKDGPPTLGFEMPEKPDSERVIEDASLLPATIVGPEDEYDPPLADSVGLSASQAARLRTLHATMPRLESQATVLEADADALLRFRMECTQASGLDGDEIAARIQQLQGLADPTDGERTALAGWIWLQDGAVVSAEDAPEAWAGAPFVSK
ncbi:MAG: hypothetical protein ACPG31_07035 [Planctomycetota bacterium]